VVAGAVMGDLAEKYGHLRGAEVETCGSAVQRFYQLFGKPVPFVFRSATNEILYMSHLDTVSAQWRKDLIWTFGVYSTFDLFFQALDEKVRASLFSALMGALKQDPDAVKSDAASVLEWATGKTEADVVNAINGGDDSEVGKALANAKNDKAFFYTRNFGAGLIKLMQVVGVEPNAENSKRWAGVFGFRSNVSAVTDISSAKFETDVGTFLSSVEKMQEVMQLYADVEAREKKKVAERLAEQAALAAEAIN
jgi:photosystem II biogenesis protein Psp29